jgi:hypothetical protein
MTTYLCLALIVIAALVVAGETNAALIAALAAIVAAFGYRLYVGEEVRAVVADVFFCFALLPIGWWVTKQWHELTGVPKPTDCK